MAELRIRDNQLGTLERVCHTFDDLKVCVKCTKHGFHPLLDQADLEGLTNLVVLDLSQNNIDNISERFVLTR